METQGFVATGGALTGFSVARSVAPAVGWGSERGGSRSCAPLARAISLRPSRPERDKRRRPPRRIDAMAETTPPVAVQNQKDISIVQFTNNRILDEGNIADIGSTLKVLIEEKDHPKLLLDFSTVDHLSSAALGMLINANNSIKQRNGQLRLTNIKPQIYEVFVITKLNKLFRIYPSREEALASFNQ
jgi:anti-sigma B factor antagonist